MSALPYSESSLFTCHRNGLITLAVFHFAFCVYVLFRFFFSFLCIFAINYPLCIVWSGECFQFDLAFLNYPLLKKKKKKHNPNVFEWSSRDVSPLLNGHSLFEACWNSSESCAYRFESLLAHLSERLDYLNEFEWRLRRVKVENIAE